MKTNIEMKQTVYDNQYTRLKIVATSQDDRAIIVPSPWGYSRLTVRMSIRFNGPCKAIMRQLCGLPKTNLKESTIILGPKMTI